MDLERRIFLGELGQSHGKLILIGLGFRLDDDRDDGFGKLHGLENDGVLLVTERIPGMNIFQTRRGSDISRVDLFDVFPFVGVHLQDTTNSFTAVPAGIVNVRTTLQNT